MATRKAAHSARASKGAKASSSSSSRASKAPKTSKPSKAAHNPAAHERVQFENGGRTFTCECATSAATPDTMWWWVSITGETQRYAAFRAEPADTQKNLEPRVLAFYEKLLADRERPREIRPQWGRPPGKKNASLND